MSHRAEIARHGFRLLALLLLSAVALQLVFALRIGLMWLVDPASTTFQRSEAWRLLVQKQRIPWSQQWVDAEQISPHLMRAVIASEDAGFVDHSGFEWLAIEGAWARNRKAEQRAEKRAEKSAEANARQAARQSAGTAKGIVAPPPVAPPLTKLVGGSTITQQLAKNLFLSGERTAARKAQELLLALMLEALLPKSRLLEIYLNNVEWGEGVFGAQAAARHYFHVDASRLGAEQAARLAVMLPAPKRFERQPGSAYVASRAGAILSRMAAVEIPK